MPSANLAKQIFRLLGIAILLSAIMWGCKAESPIRIGFLAGTSGRVADLGISGRDAAQLAIAQCNQDGGVAGHRVQLIIRDDRQNAEAARQAIQELIQEGVVAILGPMTSDMADVVTPLANQHKMLLISPTATAETLSAKDDYFFRTTATTELYARKSANYLIKSGTMRRVAAIYDLDNRTFTENWIDNFRQQFTDAGGTLIATIGYHAEGVRTFSDIAREAVATQPDGILICANSMDSAMLCQQIRKIDTDTAITLSDWGATERLLVLGGKAVEGITLVQTFDRNNQAPRYQAFRKAYLERYNREPGFPGVNTYDATQVLLSALRSQKKAQHLKEVILELKHFEGLQGDFSFDRFGDVQKPQVSISTVRDGQFVFVE